MFSVKDLESFVSKASTSLEFKFGKSDFLNLIEFIWPHTATPPTAHTYTAHCNTYRAPTPHMNIG